ncbi:MAG: tyrosine phosphatase family protein [Phyllobacterium sp.]
MPDVSFTTLTICGIEELPAHNKRAVTNVLTILDPGRDDPEAFLAFEPHERTILRFHDIIAPEDNRTLPQQDHMDQILRFGSINSTSGKGGHLLVHCHMGISRSTAAMLTLMAQGNPNASAEALFQRLAEIRPQAWPNSLMVRFADDMLGYKGELVEELGRHYGRQLEKNPLYREWMAKLGRGQEVEMAIL